MQKGAKGAHSDKHKHMGTKTQLLVLELLLMEDILQHHRCHFV